MKLMTKELENKLPALYSQEEVKDPTVYAKYFHPMCSMTWYATEYNPEDRLFFGWVENGHCSELGYFSLEEMEGVIVRGLGIERDLNFTSVPLSIIKQSHNKHSN